MEEELKEFITYLSEIKKASKNTILSYKRDVEKLNNYLVSQKIQLIEKVKETNINSYILYLEREGMSDSTVSRNIASMKAYFTYMEKQKKITNNPMDRIKPPKVDKKPPIILSEKEIDLLLEAPDISQPKGMRDRAMLELVYGTGIRVSELITLKYHCLNLKNDYLCCEDGRGKERIIPIGKTTKESLSQYLEHGRKKLLQNKESRFLFINCKGDPMSRQGFWKMLKRYSQLADIQTVVTPHTLRNSFSFQTMFY